MAQERQKLPGKEEEGACPPHPQPRPDGLDALPDHLIFQDREVWSRQSVLTAPPKHKTLGWWGQGPGLERPRLPLLFLPPAQQEGTDAPSPTAPAGHRHWWTRDEAEAHTARGALLASQGQTPPSCASSRPSRETMRTPLRCLPTRPQMDGGFRGGPRGHPIPITPAGSPLSDHTRHRGASEPRNPPLGTLLACPVPAPSPAHIQAHCALGTPSEPHSAQAQHSHRAPGAPHTWEVGSRQVPAALGGAHEEGPPPGQGPAVPQPGGHQGVPGLLAQIGDGLGYLSMWGKLGVLGLDLAGSKTSVPPRN